MRLQQNRGRKKIQNVYHRSAHENNKDIAEANANQVKKNTGSHIYSLLLFTFLFYLRMPMICECNQVAPADFVCGNFVDTVANTNNSVNRSEFQWLDFTIEKESEITNITNTSGSSISSINHTCGELSENYGESSKIFLLLSKNLTDKMHFDFCSDIPMQYVLNRNKNFSIANNKCNQPDKAISLPSNLSCAEIKNLYEIDKEYENSFRELESVYDRFTYCYTDHGNDDLLNSQHCNKDCSSCLVRFYFMSS